jgi:hypothetical protein
VITSLSDLSSLQSEGTIAPVRDLEPSVSPEVEAAVMHALAREPRFRPASAAELAHELAGSDERPTRPLPLRPARSTRRARLLLFGALVVTALAIALGLARLGGDGDGASPPPAPAGVSPPVRGATPAQQARNLALWLRRNSR